MRKKKLRRMGFPGVIAGFLFLTLLLSGCCSKAPGRAAGPAEEKAQSRLQVVSTIFPQYDFARQIAGDRADVYMLLKPGEEIHSYEPTPQDIKMIQNSDLFIYTGGENDVWVENILASLGEEDSGPRTVRLLDLVETFDEEELEGMMPEKGEHDHEAEDIHDHEAEETGGHVLESATITGGHTHVHGGEPDEHVWTAPKNCVILIDELTEEFCTADPANAETYRTNGVAYRKAFEELDAQYLQAAADAKRRTILFGDRFPFRYLAEELGLTCYAAFSGCSAESEPSAATIAFLIDKAAEERLPVVFQIEFSNGNIARAISEAAQVKMKKNTAKQTGNTAENSTESQDSGTGAAAETELPAIQVLQLHSCQNLTRDEFERGETCLSLMTENLEALRTALDAR